MPEPVTTPSSNSPSRSSSLRKRLNAAIIGYGVSGRLSHAYGIQSNAVFNIVAVCDLLETNRNRAKEELGCRTYDNYHELLENESLDLVSVVTRSDTHKDIVCHCLKGNINTVVTKPWVLNEAEAKDVLEAESHSKATIFPWIPAYWSPDYTMIQELLENNTIGDVFLIRRYYTDFRYRSDWQTNRCYGGGYLLNWSAHLVQPVLGLANSRVKRVFGQLQQSINAGDAEDNFLAVLEFENGIRGIAEFTESLSPLPGFLVQGTEGTITSDYKTVTVRKANPKKPDEVDETVYPITGKVFGDEADIYRDIAANLLNGMPYRTPSEVAMEGTRVVDAIRQSHELRQLVEIKP